MGAAGLLFLPYFTKMFFDFDADDFKIIEKTIKKNAPKKVINSLGLNKVPKLGETLEKIVYDEHNDSDSPHSPVKASARAEPREINPQVESTAKEIDGMLDHAHMFNEDGLDANEAEHLELNSIKTDHDAAAVSGSASTSAVTASQLMQEAAALKSYYQSAKDDPSPQNIQQVKFAINETFEDIEDQLQIIQNEINASQLISADTNHLETIFKECQYSLAQFIQTYQLIKQTYDESNFDETMDIILTLEQPAQELQSDTLSFLDLSAQVSKDVKVFGKAAQDIYFSRVAGNSTTQPSQSLIQLMESYNYFFATLAKGTVKYNGFCKLPDKSCIKGAPLLNSQ